MELTEHDKRMIHQAARHIMGSVVGILSIMNNNMDSDRVREICGDIYIKTDAVVTLVEKAEKRLKKSK